MKIGDKYQTRDGLGEATIVYISKNIKPYPISAEIGYFFNGKDKPPGYLIMSYTTGGYYGETGESKWDLMINWNRLDTYLRKPGVKNP